ncbi:RtcB family protein [Parvibaculum sp.]|uniref:RtcB family protein n=1 Tax=Parvibaculum sp. TaxID=2024848 RepID=UPI00320EF571
MDHRNFNTISVENGVPIKAWTKGVPVDAAAEQQLRNVAGLPFVFHHVAAMPDVHWGMGATIGSVIATRKAIIPAAVGVDIGCGMMATRTNISAARLPDDLRSIRLAIEAAVPHGRTDNGGANDRGAWSEVPQAAVKVWAGLAQDFAQLCERTPALARSRSIDHLGTLGTGNHFIELCLDEADILWVMLHSGSRGVGNRIGTVFIELAKKEMERFFVHLPDANLAYLPQGTEHFADYMRAVSWAQKFARANRQLMMDGVLAALAQFFPDIETDEMAVNCHHNYVDTEEHFGETVLVTRKGAVRARAGDLGIIPGSMGARSFIVRGKGNPESFCSCSHGAGRLMSRNQATRQFSLEDHAVATAHVECRKDGGVIDETPGAYKDINAVMNAQADLVEIVHTLRQVVCVKG